MVKKMQGETELLLFPPQQLKVAEKHLRVWFKQYLLDQPNTCTFMPFYNFRNIYRQFV